jgi:oligoribonuclease NrnB/cAMP/cGMP phosphodiesterase (DHH superfamily)
MIPYMAQFAATGGASVAVRGGMNTLMNSSAPLVGKGVWKYFYPNTKVPETVELLSKFDSFMFTEDEKANVMKFQYGMKSLGNETSINGNAWKDVFNSTSEFIDSLLIRGDVILTYHNEYYDIQVANKCARTAKLDVQSPGLDKTFNVIFINSSCAFSEAFASVYNKEIHDIMMVGYINKDKKWVYSFYCPSDKKIDVSLIAKSFGGGGHKGAAGCLVDKQLI